MSPDVMEPVADMGFWVMGRLERAPGYGQQQQGLMVDTGALTIREVPAVIVQCVKWQAMHFRRGRS